MRKTFSSFSVPVSALLVVMLAVACENTSYEPDEGLYGAGVYVVNEGFFNGNNGSVTYYNPEDETLVNHVFESVNGRPPGDVIQSFATKTDDVGFVVANNSGKVEVVDLETFQTLSAPLTASYPRYFLPVSDTKGYLTNGSMAGYVYVVDLANYEITDSIPAGFGPEFLLQVDNNIFVSNSGGWSVDSTLTVINATNDHVEDTIFVGMAPVDLGLDADRNIWVYCKGYAVWDWNPPYDLISETPSFVQKIDPVSRVILWQGEVGNAGDYAFSPAKLAISADGQYVYFLRPDGVYCISATDPSVPEDPVITGSFYGIEVHPAYGDLYLFEASLSGPGTMHVYDGSLNPVISHAVGIMPNGAVFVEP